MRLFGGYLKGGSLRAVVLRALTGSAGLRVIGMGFAFLVGLQLARGLGPVGYGIYGVAMSIIALLMAPTEFGLPQLVVRETAANASRGEWGKVRGLLRWSLSTTLLSSLIIAALVVAGLFVLQDRVSDALSATLMVGLAMIPLVAIGKTRGAALRGLRHIVKGQLPDAVLRPGIQSLLLFLLAWLSISLTPAIGMFAGVVGAAVGLLVTMLMLRRLLPSQAKLTVPESTPAAWRSSCIPMAMTEAMRIVQGHLAVLVLGFMASAASVGTYKVASSIGVLVAMTAGIFTSVVAPLISSLFTTGDRVKLQKLLSWTTAGMLAGTAVLSAPFIFTAPEAITLVFGAEFAPAAVPLQVLCVGALLTASAGTAGTLLNMTGHETSVRRASYESLALLVVLLPLLVWWADAVGAALATVAAGMLWRVRMVRDCRKLLDLEPGLLGLLRTRQRGEVS